MALRGRLCGFVVWTSVFFHAVRSLFFDVVCLVCFALVSFSHSGRRNLWHGSFQRCMRCFTSDPCFGSCGISWSATELPRCTPGCTRSCCMACSPLVVSFAWTGKPKRFDVRRKKEGCIVDTSPLSCTLSMDMRIGRFEHTRYMCMFPQNAYKSSHPGSLVCILAPF